MDLSTTYLGLHLPHPLIVGSGPLTEDLDMVKELEDAGAAALVLRPLFEEEITGEQMYSFLNTESHSRIVCRGGQLRARAGLGAWVPGNTSSICTG